MKKMHSADLSTADSGRLEKILLDLPKLPNVLRYFDDFDDTTKALKDFDKLNLFSIGVNGSSESLNFSRFQSDLIPVMKFVFYYLITSDYSPNTSLSYLNSLSQINPSLLMELLIANPDNIKSPWKRLVSEYSNRYMMFPAVKQLLIFKSQYQLSGWSNDYIAFIKVALPYPWPDRYAGVRSGHVFLSTQEEAQIVRFISDASIRQRNSRLHYPLKELQNICILVCSYLFGMRSIQIALLTMRDVRVWRREGEDNPSVHLTFKMVKQKSQANTFPLTRRIKHDWSFMFEVFYESRKADGASGDDRLFDIKSATEVSRIITELGRSIVGCNVSATIFRHTAAQRLVDAGANQEEVAEFMGHSDIRTCLVYYASSPTQAERVNKALGISPIYQQVVKIAHDKFISPNELARLKGDQQIAGVPHGIPITGIGGCSTGQPFCPYNPITSCYGCQKFMPVSDLVLHQKVLLDLRCIVMFFEKTSRDEGNSPAFMQLMNTISQVQAVINELEVSCA